MWTPTVANCDQYMDDRTGKYEYRAVRYRLAIEHMKKHGLDDTMTIVDLGAGMTEFDYCLRVEYNWRGRYIPVDGGIDGTDLNRWHPPRRAHWFVALEILEHLTNWEWVLSDMKNHATMGVVVSTPNPFTTDVLAMDDTHVVEISADMLEAHELTVHRETCYGGVFNRPGMENYSDCLMGVWTK